MFLEIKFKSFNKTCVRSKIQGPDWFKVRPLVCGQSTKSVSAFHIRKIDITIEYNNLKIEIKFKMTLSKSFPYVT